MSDGTTIEWLDQPGYKAASWNPTRGCTRVSEGCHHCYAEVMAARFSGPGQWGHGFAEMRGGDHRWTGRVELVEDQLLMPMKWRKPRCIFVNSTSDLFHERLPDEAIDRVFAVMALCPQHRFIVLTKRPERMRNWFSIGLRCVARVFDAAERAGGTVDGVWPLPNVWIGTSVEDQATADERIPHLLATPGPWERDGISHYGHQPRVHSSDRLVAVFGNAEDSTEAQSKWGNDAAFAAAARTDVPTLASDVLTLVDQVRQLRAALAKRPLRDIDRERSGE